MNKTALQEELAALFLASGKDHHQAFIETDGDDPDWPIWYADYLHESLKRMLKAAFTRSELVYLMVMVSKEQALRAPGSDWANYYARFFLERYSF